MLTSPHWLGSFVSMVANFFSLSVRPFSSPSVLEGPLEKVSGGKGSPLLLSSSSVGDSSFERRIFAGVFH